MDKFDICIRSIDRKSLLKYNLMLIAILMLLIGTFQPVSMGFEVDTIINKTKSKQNIQLIECGSIDVRNDVSNLNNIRGCSAILGNLVITLISHDLKSNISFSDYTFPELREITGYFIIFYVRGLVSIRKMFPNLVVIRGRFLFMNYALGITNVAHLEALEFKSLIAIQRGHVFIDKNPELCHLNTINFDRLTLTPGQNRIYDSAYTCDEYPKDCVGCQSGYCWSPLMCQKFENDNVATLAQCLNLGLNCTQMINKSSKVSSQSQPIKCHPECLGGCYNETNAGCVVCRGLTDHGVCVKECPKDKLTHPLYQRCYTQEECTKPFFTHQDQCIEFCPSNFTEDMVNRTCAPCTGKDCLRKCFFYSNDTMIMSLDDVEYLERCEKVSGNLILKLSNKVNDDDLVKGFKNIKIIEGSLVIERTPFITSLNFLKNLQKIEGKFLIHGMYSLKIYSNENLREFWKPEGLKLVKGGISIILNNKVCNRLIKEFVNSIDHDASKDQIYKNDQEVLCEPAILDLNVKAMSHKEIEVSWKKEQTDEQVEILYRYLPLKSKVSEDSELDTNVCRRIIWNRRIMFRSDLNASDSNHYVYIINDLKPYTQYAVLVKSFGPDEQPAQSAIKQIRTLSDFPSPPRVITKNKTQDSITLELSGNTNVPEEISYFLIQYTERPENPDLLNTRDYCVHPPLPFEEIEENSRAAADNDYDECCSLIEEAREEEQFIDHLNTIFKCGVDSTENCGESLNEVHNNMLTINKTEKFVQTTNLKHYTLYTFRIYACNALGCGSYTMHNVRTSYKFGADNVTDLTVCSNSTSEEYFIDFTEPQNPNGMIVSYVIHFRAQIADSHVYQAFTNCVSRNPNNTAKFKWSRKINETYSEFAVRSHSLSGNAISQWVSIKKCEELSKPETHIYTSSYQIFLISCFTFLILIICCMIYKQGYLSRIQQYVPLWGNLRPAMVQDDNDMGSPMVEFYNSVENNLNED